MSNSQELQFPSHYPIKLFGKNEPDFSHNILQLVQTLFPNFKENNIKQQLSSHGKYIALDLNVYIENREQLEPLIQAIKSHPQVLMSL